MTQKRQQVVIDKDLRIEFAEKCLRDRLITKRENVKAPMDLLMQMYIDGMLDEVMPGYNIEKRLGSNVTRVQLDRDLKNDFEYRAYSHGGLISDPSRGARALEYMMQMYLDGKIEIKKEE